jgi:hypothetical protein
MAFRLCRPLTSLTSSSRSLQSRSSFFLSSSVRSLSSFSFQKGKSLTFSNQSRSHALSSIVWWNEGTQFSPMIYSSFLSVEKKNFHTTTETMFLFSLIFSSHLISSHLISSSLILPSFNLIYLTSHFTNHKITKSQNHKITK